MIIGFVTNGNFEIGKIPIKIHKIEFMIGIIWILHDTFQLNRQPLSHTLNNQWHQ